MIQHRMTTTGPRTKSGNTWMIGEVVRVGFLNLRVIGVRSIKDGLPDIYSLESIDHIRKYDFVPHHGLTRIIDDKESL